MLVLALVCTAIIYAGALYSYLPKKLGRLAGYTQRKARKFDKILDDFMGKKFGAGEFFYGERSSTLGKNASQSADRNAALTPNAVLVVGSPNCAWLQWTIIELIEKGFTVRLLCTSAFAAYQATSLPGISFDVVEAKTGVSDGEIAVAVQNVQAIILGIINKEMILRIPFLKEPPIRERVLEMVVQAVSAKVLDVKKMVLLTTESDSQTERLQTQIVQSGIDYVVLHPAGGITRRDENRRAAHLCIQAVDPRASIPTSRGKLSAADVAEAVVQALLQPFLVNVTCVVAPAAAAAGDLLMPLRGTSTASILANELVRPRRPAFYRVGGGGGEGKAREDGDRTNSKEDTKVTVEMVVREAALRRLGVLQAVRDPDEVRRQLLEDEEVERYWAALFRGAMTAQQP